MTILITSCSKTGRCRVVRVRGEYKSNIRPQVPVYNTCAQRARDDGHRLGRIYWYWRIPSNEEASTCGWFSRRILWSRCCFTKLVGIRYEQQHRIWAPTVPVTKRFQYFSPSELTQFVKSIVRLEDFVRFTNVHWAHLRNGTTSKITGGKEFYYPRTQPILTWDIAERKTDVAIIHHYRYKSRNEYIKKKMRGDASSGKCHRLKTKRMKQHTPNVRNWFERMIW